MIIRDIYVAITRKMFAIAVVVVVVDIWQLVPSNIGLLFKSKDADVGTLFKCS